MPTITTSNRTTSSVVLNGSGFLPQLLSCPPQAVTIYDAQNNILAASYLDGSVLLADSWQLTLTGITDAGFFATYSIDAEDNPGCYQFGFYIAPFAVPENTVKRFKTVFSKITKGLSYNSTQSQRRKFPTI
jgi:hypothetical protein